MAKLKSNIERFQDIKLLYELKAEYHKRNLKKAFDKGTAIERTANNGLIKYLPQAVNIGKSIFNIVQKFRAARA